jgi:hypothetical protein
MERLLQVVAGCPDGVTRDALVLNGFSELEIDRAAALCLVRVKVDTLRQGLTVTRY